MLPIFFCVLSTPAVLASPCVSEKKNSSLPNGKIPSLLGSQWITMKTGDYGPNEFLDHADSKRRYSNIAAMRTGIDFADTKE